MMTVSNSEVMRVARECGLHQTMVCRYRQQGLLAQAVERCGGGYWFPEHAISQVENIGRAIQEARQIGVSRQSMSWIRHFHWWTGGQIEDWRRWQSDRIREALPRAEQARVFMRLSEDERDRLAIRFANSKRQRCLLSGRMSLADKESVAVHDLHFKMGALEDLVLPNEGADQDPMRWFEAVRAYLRRPVDDRGGDPVRDDTLEDLLTKGLVKEPHGTVLLPWVASALWPHPSRWPDLIGRIPPERAAARRDAIRTAPFINARLQKSLERIPLLAASLMIGGLALRFEPDTLNGTGTD